MFWKNIFSTGIVIAMSLLVSSAGIANGNLNKYEPQVEVQKGKDQTNFRLYDDRAKIRLWLSTHFVDEYGGIYTDGNGYNIVLLTKVHSDLEDKIKNLSSFPEKIKFHYEKYNDKELKTAKEKLSRLMYSGTLKLEAVGKNNNINKVNVYISEEYLKSSKQKVLKYINEDMVEWVIGDLELKLR